MKKALFLTPLIVLVLSLVFAAKALAVNYEITGNGAGSTSNVTVNQQNSTSYGQSNTSNINNNVDVNCNTGGNSASGNTGGNAGVNTGNCSSNVNISNQGNSNCIGNCVKSSPSPRPGSSNIPAVGGGSGGNGGSGGSGSSSAGGETLGQTGASQNLALMLGGMSLIFGGLYQTKRILAIF